MSVYQMFSSIKLTRTQKQLTSFMYAGEFSHFGENSRRLERRLLIGYNSWNFEKVFYSTISHQISNFRKYHSTSNISIYILVFLLFLNSLEIVRAEGKKVSLLKLLRKFLLVSQKLNSIIVIIMQESITFANLHCVIGCNYLLEK